MILLVSKDHSGKLVNAQFWLNQEKKPPPAVVSHEESLKELLGRLVIAQLWLKAEKK